MIGKRLIASAVLFFTLLGMPGDAEKRKRCADAGPPPIWIVTSPYPFQAGTERAFDELYHGPWKVTVPVTLYARARSKRVVGSVAEGETVEALLGESIIVHPLRYVAAHDFQVVTKVNLTSTNVATMHKGDLFWVLDLGGEGGFSVWWHCRVVGWDSTEATEGDQQRLGLLGTNEERWVHVRATKTGVSGWFEDAPTKDGQILTPAVPTSKAVG